MNNLILKSLIEYMENVLNRCGLMYRIFGRTKTEESIRRKFQIKNYVEVGKKMQDFFGIRVTLYFSDDKELLYNYLKESTSFVNESNNKNSTTNSGGFLYGNNIGINYYLVEIGLALMQLLL